MQNNKRVFPLLLALALVLVLAFPAVALAQPPIPAFPAVYSGAVTTADGNPAPNGVEVFATVGDYTTIRVKVTDGRYPSLPVSPPRTLIGSEVKFFADVDGSGKIGPVEAVTLEPVIFPNTGAEGAQTFYTVDLAYEKPHALLSIAVAGGVTMRIKESRQYKAMGRYYDTGLEDITSRVTWKVDDTNVARVGVGGLVTAAGPGTTNVNATLAGVTGKVQVSVISLVSIALEPQTATLQVGGTQQFTAVGTYSDEATILDITKEVDWTSSDPGVASIDANGVATAKAAGTTTITAALEGVESTASLTVQAPVVTSVVVDPIGATVKKGQTIPLKALAFFDNGTSQDVTATATWSSSNPAVATVVGGLVTAVAPGTATITATSAGKTGQATITVPEPVLTMMVIAPPTFTLGKGETTQFTATATYDDGSTRDVTQQATWSSSNTTVATVANGLATGVGGGAVTITATFQGLSPTGSLVVEAPAGLWWIWIIVALVVIAIVAVIFMRMRKGGKVA